MERANVGCVEEGIFREKMMEAKTRGQVNKAVCIGNSEQAIGYMKDVHCGR